jgi:hypothetical protein
MRHIFKTWIAQNQILPDQSFFKPDPPLGFGRGRYLKGMSLFRGRAGTAISGASDDPRRGAAHRSEHRQTAGAAKTIGDLLAISVSHVDDLLDRATMRPETRRLGAPCSR